MKKINILVVSFFTLGICLFFAPSSVYAYAPSYVENIAVESATSSQLVITWDEPYVYEEDPVITSYDIEVASNDNFSNASAASTDGDARTATVTGLNSNTTYYIRMRATNADGVGDWDDIENTTAPSKAKKVVKKKQSSAFRSVTMKWNAPLRCSASTCVYNYKVHKKKNKDLIKSSYSYDNKVTISDLSIGKKYTITVQACTSYYDQCSPWSSKKTFKLK